MSEEESDGVTNARVLNMRRYESDVINEYDHRGDEEKKRETKDELRDRISKLKSDLKHAKSKGKEKEIARIERELGDAELMLQLPEKLDVDLELSQPTVDQAMPTEGEQMEKYWHYKVMHQNFVGEDAIDLTIDDSDPFVYAARQKFIEKYCEPYTEEHELDGGLKIPQAIWNSLFPHQRAAIEWEWRLWRDKAGGIEGDEMGLGKTIICAVFILGLIRSGLLNKPTLILCPLTVAKQWIREFHIWCPEVRAILLHQTRANTKETDEAILESVDDSPVVVVTNYEYLNRKGDIETQSVTVQLVDWGCLLCDEGHKIRNAESGISKHVKSITSDFRLAISGSPIQNSLLELWSLFDFAYPGLLGSSEVFDRDFATPIKIGGYANATTAEVYRAYYRAVELRKLIKPYLLRRMKADVMADLPMKSEKILFTYLTDVQISAYEDFLNSSFCHRILSGQAGDQAFAGIDHLRKICDHPALLEESSALPTIENSAKLLLLKKILPVWKQNGHRVLLFSQYLQMLDFLQQLMGMLDLDYFRIDGATNAGQRQNAIDRFNAGERFACLLTTKVGGIGVNLIGADRVIIVDPDWNPATDLQALERAWRIGQTRNVCVYRLITAGTIEEKMYKKQIFKQYLSNKILQSPDQKRMFKRQTIWDLFKLDTREDREGNGEEEVKEEPIAEPDETQQGNEEEDGDRKMVEMILAEGEISRIGDHDVLFDNVSSKEMVDASIAEIDTKKAISRLNMDSDEMQELQTKLVSFMRKNNGMVSSEKIFDEYHEGFSLKQLKHVLRTIAVCKKKKHVWILRHKYLKGDHK